MERSGTETQIKTTLSQDSFFERFNDDRERFVRNAFPQEGSEAFIRLYGHQWVGA
jgi:hypothetical protein